MMKIKDKVLLIKGEIGPFAADGLNRFWQTDHFQEIYMFYHYEKKQDDLRNLHNNDKSKSYIGSLCHVYRLNLQVNLTSPIL